MQKATSVITQCSLLFLLLNFVLSDTSVEATTEYKFDSTLEVLQGANLYPGNSMMCGPACLYIGARCLGIEQYSVNDIAKMADWDYTEGTSMLGLENACRKMGFYAEAFRLNINQLENLMSRSNSLAVVENQNHFFLFVKAKNGKFLVVTTPIKPEWVEAKKIADVWDGKVILFSKQPIKVKTVPRKLLFFAGLGGCYLIIAVGVGYSWKKHFQHDTR